MEFKTDIEIAQACTMQPITEIAKVAGVDEQYLELYGKYKAKVDYNLLRETDRKDGKLILINLRHGEKPLHWLHDDEFFTGMTKIRFIHEEDGSVNRFLYSTNQARNMKFVRNDHV